MHRERHDSAPDTLDDFLERLKDFCTERDWNQYHTPRSLAISVAIETGELLEHVQWRSDEEVEAYLQADDHRLEMAEEVADVLIYSLRLCQRLGYGPLELLWHKLQKNGIKYPADRYRGRYE